MDDLGNILYVNFLGYAHWFISIIISQTKDHSVSVSLAKYATSIVAKYLDTATVKTGTIFTRPLCHIIWYSPKLMHKIVMSKLRSQLENTIYLLQSLYYIIDLSIFYKSGFEFCSAQIRKVFIKTLVNYTLKDWYIYLVTLGTIIIWA